MRSCVVTWAVRVAVVVPLMLTMQSCIWFMLMDDDKEPTPTTYSTFVWRIDNRYSSEMIAYTVYETPSKLEMCSYVTPIQSLIPNQANFVYRASNVTHNPYEEFEAHPDDIRIYFLLPPGNEYISGVVTADLAGTLSQHVAYLDVTEEWMHGNFYNIRFPDDCTINPDLDKFCDLGKLVERHGAPKGKGWDEVWKRWQTNHKTL